jgi:hypothetical protein
VVTLVMVKSSKRPASQASNLAPVLSSSLYGQNIFILFSTIIL